MGTKRFIYSIFPGGSDGKESACNAGNLGSTPGSGRSPGEKNGNPNPIFLPGKSHEQRKLRGYSTRGHKESDMTKWLSKQNNIQKNNYIQYIDLYYPAFSLSVDIMFYIFYICLFCESPNNILWTEILHYFVFNFPASFVSDCCSNLTVYLPLPMRFSFIIFHF